MVVRAADDALADFSLDGCPTVPTSDHPSHFDAFAFWVDVIEIQNRWICFPAVNAWMRCEILQRAQM
jgi:hypothetical protein